jgi:hypothetical protein
MIGTWGWLDGEGFGELFFRAVCGGSYRQAQFCRDLINSVAGPNPENLDPVILSSNLAENKPFSLFCCYAILIFRLLLGLLFRMFSAGHQYQLLGNSPKIS